MTNRETLRISVSFQQGPDAQIRVTNDPQDLDAIQASCKSAWEGRGLWSLNHEGGSVSVDFSTAMILRLSRVPYQEPEPETRPTASRQPLSDGTLLFWAGLCFALGVLGGFLGAGLLISAAN